MSSSDRYPGQPSEKFVEEKLLISEMLKKWRDVEEALPLLKSTLCQINEH